jgi:hypothetical protein
VHAAILDGWLIVADQLAGLSVVAFGGRGTGQVFGNPAPRGPSQHSRAQVDVQPRTRQVTDFGANAGHFGPSVIEQRKPCRMIA